MKFFRPIILLLIFFLSLNTQCNEDDEPMVYNPDCNAENLIIDVIEYENAQSDFYTITGVSFDEDCLMVSFSASGCSGETWELELIDSEAVLESLPPQRNLKLVLTNSEACLAVFEQTKTFDLRNLRLEGVDEIILNVEGLPEPLSYNY